MQGEGEKLVKLSVNGALTGQEKWGESGVVSEEERKLMVWEGDRLVNKKKEMQVDQKR